MKQVLLVLLLLVSVSSCRNQDPEAQPLQEISESEIMLTDVQIENSDIVVGNIEERKISTTLRVNGRIDVPPQSRATISAPLGGYLKSIKGITGIWVKRGAILASIEDNLYIQIQQDYLAAKSEFTFIEAEFNRHKELNKSKATSDKIFEQAKSTYETQKILVKSLAEKLMLIHIDPASLNENNISRSINIYAPIDGLVSKINVNIGKYVTPGEVLFELINHHDAYLVLNIFENDMNKIAIGQNVVSFTNNRPEVLYHAKITHIKNEIGADGTSSVICYFNSYDEHLIPGMYMNAEISLGQNLKRLLPDESIVHFEGGEYIFVKIGENSFKMIKVKTGENEKGYTEIISLTDLSDYQIVLRGAYSLLMSLKNKETP